jgi:glyoxylase-like metal-dependent hydrolase (beta-lactamase superfamily II)
MSSKLQFDVLVTTCKSSQGGVPAGKEDVQWVGSSCTVIHDGKDCVLVDTFLNTDKNQHLYHWIVHLGLNLKYIYVTHGHGDHWYGIKSLLNKFPDAQVLATNGTIHTMGEGLQAFIDYWTATLPGNMPTIEDLIDIDIVKSVNDMDYRFQLGGHDFIAYEADFTDTCCTTYLHVPSIDLVVSGDIVYCKTFPYLGNTSAPRRQERIKALDDIAGLHPKVVIPGHTLPYGGDGPESIPETKKLLQDLTILPPRPKPLWNSTVQ